MSTVWTSVSALIRWTSHPIGFSGCRNFQTCLLYGQSPKVYKCPLKAWSEIILCPSIHILFLWTSRHLLRWNLKRIVDLLVHREVYQEQWWQYFVQTLKWWIHNPQDLSGVEISRVTALDTWLFGRSSVGENTCYTKWEEGCMQVYATAHAVL